jgi:hypothetical protein
LGIEGQAIEKEDTVFQALRRTASKQIWKAHPRNVENSIRFFDFQCSAQKSVSIMAITMEIGDCTRLMTVQLALPWPIGEVCRPAGRPSRHKHCETTGNICVAAFRHDARD